MQLAIITNKLSEFNKSKQGHAEAQRCHTSEPAGLSCETELAFLTIKTQKYKTNEVTGEIKESRLSQRDHVSLRVGLKLFDFQEIAIRNIAMTAQEAVIAINIFGCFSA